MSISFDEFYINLKRKAAEDEEKLFFQKED